MLTLRRLKAKKSQQKHVAEKKLLLRKIPQTTFHLREEFLEAQDGFRGEAKKNQAVLGRSGKRRELPCIPRFMEKGSFQNPNPQVPLRFTLDTRADSSALTGGTQRNLARGDCI